MGPKTRLKLVLAITTFLLVICGGGLVMYSHARARAAEFRYHVFCEVLAPGMSLSDVRGMLAEYGPMDERERVIDDEHTALIVGFDDPSISSQLGGTAITLVFDRGAYQNARVPVPFSDNYENICP